MSLRILLVRHGLSSFNLEHRIQGRDDLSSLTDEGVKQALATGEALRDLPITAAYSSPLRRAKDTASALLAAQGGGQPQPAAAGGGRARGRARARPARRDRKSVV